MTSRLLDPEGAHALFAPLLAERTEVAAFAYLAADRQVLGVRHARSGRMDAIDLPMRDVVGDAIAFGARALVMAHNHPSGDPTPSAADRAATRRLVQALEPLDISLLDHLVLGHAGWTSFRRLGLL